MTRIPLRREEGNYLKMLIRIVNTKGESFSISVDENISLAYQLEILYPGHVFFFNGVKITPKDTTTSLPITKLQMIDAVKRMKNDDPEITEHILFYNFDPKQFEYYEGGIAAVDGNNS